MSDSVMPFLPFDMNPNPQAGACCICGEPMMLRRDSHDRSTCGKKACASELGAQKRRAAPRGDCPVCGKPAVRRHGQQLQTCGEHECTRELTARNLRGNVYGNRGGGPPRSENASYAAIHVRARRAIAGQSCAQADGTCKGRIEAALRADMPESLLRVSELGMPYYSGPNTHDAYRPLCRSHHGREGALRAAADRSPLIAAALAADRLLSHECTGECRLCLLLQSFDEMATQIADAEIDLIVKQAEEARAAWRPFRIEACRRGHRLADPNLVESDKRRGGRTCLACKRAHDRGRRRLPGYDAATEADQIYAELLAGAPELIPSTAGDGLALPWTGQAEREGRAT